MIDISKTVRKIRRDRNLTQVEVAKALNVTPGYISKIENGRTVFSMRLFKQFAELTNTSIDAIIRGDMEDYSPSYNEVKVVNIRLVKEPSLYSDKPISSPHDVYELIAKELAQYDREVFAILNLKTNGEVINLNICSVGTLNASMVSPREVFKSSILSNAASFIAIHNHPSGNLTPSDADKSLTERLYTCGKYMDIKMLDHIIVAGETGEMFSFKGEGLMSQIERQANENFTRESDIESQIGNKVKEKLPPIEKGIKKEDAYVQKDKDYETQQREL